MSAHLPGGIYVGTAGTAGARVGAAPRLWAHARAQPQAPGGGRRALRSAGHPQSRWLPDGGGQVAGRWAGGRARRHEQCTRHALTGCPAAPECHSASPGTGGPAPRRSLRREGAGVSSGGPSAGGARAQQGQARARLRACGPARTPGGTAQPPHSLGHTGPKSSCPLGLCPHLGPLPISWSALALPRPTAGLWGKHLPSPTRRSQHQLPTGPTSAGAGLVAWTLTPGPSLSDQRAASPAGLRQALAVSLPGGLVQTSPAGGWGRGEGWSLGGGAEGSRWGRSRGRSSTSVGQPRHTALLPPHPRPKTPEPGPQGSVVGVREAAGTGTTEARRPRPAPQ